jgi:hypothetical protein
MSSTKAESDMLASQTNANVKAMKFLLFFGFHNVLLCPGTDPLGPGQHRLNSNLFLSLFHLP